MAGLKWFSHALLVVVLERLGIIQSPTTWWATASVSSGVSLGERGEEMLHCLSARNHFYTSNTTICPLRWKIDFWCEVSQHVSVTKEWRIQILLPTKVLTTIPLAGALLFYQGQRFKYGSKVGRSQTGYERDVYLAHWPWKKPFEDQSRFAWTLRKCETKNLSKFTLISIHAGSSLGVKIWMIQFVPCQVMLIYGLTCCMCACHTISRKKRGSFCFDSDRVLDHDPKWSQTKEAVALSCPSNWYRKCATCAIWTRYTLACFAHLTLQRYVFSTTVTRVKSFQNQRFMAKGMKKVTSTIFVYLHDFNGWNQWGCQ